MKSTPPIGPTTYDVSTGIKGTQTAVKKVQTSQRQHQGKGEQERHNAIANRQTENKTEETVDMP